GGVHAALGQGALTVVLVPVTSGREAGAQPVGQLVADVQAPYDTVASVLVPVLERDPVRIVVVVVVPVVERPIRILVVLEPGQVDLATEPGELLHVVVGVVPGPRQVLTLAADVVGAR